MYQVLSSYLPVSPVYQEHALLWYVDC